MDRYSEQAVRQVLQPFHSRIKGVVERAFQEWLTLRDCMSAQGFDPPLYPRTVSNYVFDAVARNAIREFAIDPFVSVRAEPQTVKFIFGNVVVARFKKGDANNLGQNLRTQAR